MKKKRILIVEDEESIANIEKTYLERSGYEVSVAYDGKTGLEKFQMTSPHLIVLDLMLPRMSGEEVLQRIRLTSDIPVIIVSAKVAEEDRIQGLRQGADDYLIKPFSARELVERVKAVLRRIDIDAPKRDHSYL